MTNFSDKWDKEDNEKQNKPDTLMDDLDKALSINHPPCIGPFYIVGKLYDCTIKCKLCDFTWTHKAWWKFW